MIVSHYNFCRYWISAFSVLYRENCENSARCMRKNLAVLHQLYVLISPKWKRDINDS